MNEDLVQLTPDLIVRRDWIGGVQIVERLYTVPELKVWTAFLGVIDIPYEGNIQDARNELLFRLFDAAKSNEKMETLPGPDNWAVWLSMADDLKKINVIKSVRFASNIGLKEAKDIVDRFFANGQSAPQMIAKFHNRDEATKSLACLEKDGVAGGFIT